MGILWRGLGRSKIPRGDGVTGYGETDSGLTFRTDLGGKTLARISGMIQQMTECGAGKVVLNSAVGGDPHSK